MRQITKTVTLTIDAKPFTFRLRKMDALTGACLLRRLSALEPPSTSATSATPTAPAPPASAAPSPDLLTLLFTSLPDDDLRALMTRSLEHVDVLLDAGYQPVMQLGEWSWSDLQYDPAGALSLTLKEIVWTLDGFFVENGSTSPPARPVT